MSKLRVGLLLASKGNCVADIESEYRETLRTPFALGLVQDLTSDLLLISAQVKQSDGSIESIDDISRALWDLARTTGMLAKTLSRRLADAESAALKVERRKRSAAMLRMVLEGQKQAEVGSRFRADRTTVGQCVRSAIAVLQVRADTVEKETGKRSPLAVVTGPVSKMPKEQQALLMSLLGQYQRELELRSQGHSFWKEVWGIEGRDVQRPYL